MEDDELREELPAKTQMEIMNLNTVMDLLPKKSIQTETY